MNNERSSRPEVRNPVLRLASSRRAAELFAALPEETRQGLLDALAEMSEECRVLSEKCWRKHKAPMAAYWKAFAVYWRHIRLALRRPTAPTGRGAEDPSG